MSSKISTMTNRPRTTEAQLISIVIPLYNEEENVPRLYEELSSVARELPCSTEVVFVDDGSTDRTVEVVREHASTGELPVRLVSFRRNFGQTAAMAAGFDHVRGDVVVLMDGDLQNDPAEIPRMLARLEEGYDLVAGWRKDRKDPFLSRRMPSIIANKLISKITGVHLHDYGCTLKVMRAEVAHNIKLYGEMHRFIPALAAETGVKISEMPVNHRPRLYGTSKYGISRTFRVLLDLLTVKFFLGYSTRPIHMFGFLGMGTGGLGALILGVLSFEKIFLAHSIGDRPLLMLGGMLLLIGLQFVCFGLLAEILVRTYHESQDKRIYSVRTIDELGTGAEELANQLKINQSESIIRR